MIESVHDELIAEHGGAYGLRDSNALESALTRPRNKAEYGDPSVAELAAAYAFGLARNHPFVDGNKRVAAVTLELFLVLNGYRLTASDAELVATILDLAAGELSEEELAAWIAERTVAKP